MFQYEQILGYENKIHMIFVNGDWDSVVPFTDTQKNLKKLKL